MARFAPAVAALALLTITGAPARAADAPALAAMLSYPFDSGLVAAEHGDAIAWVRNVRGARNVWLARGPAFAPRQVTANNSDDGQELSDLDLLARRRAARTGCAAATMTPTGRPRATSPPTRPPTPRSPR